MDPIYLLLRSSFVPSSTMKCSPSNLPITENQSQISKPNKEGLVMANSSSETQNIIQANSLNKIDTGDGISSVNSSIKTISTFTSTNSIRSSSNDIEGIENLSQTQNLTDELTSSNIEGLTKPEPPKDFVIM